MLAWTSAAGSLFVWGAASLAGGIGMRQELGRFEAARTHAALTVTEPDLSLWSSQRIQAWRDSQQRPAAPPLAVLRVPRIHLEVPVLEGTDDWTLNRGAGHIAETALPGADGNAGIAGHRDGYFRVLKDIAVGDALEIETLHGTAQYVIERTWIVQPEDVSVLDPTSSSVVTLVTCFPFYFVGSAPQRFIVRAVRTPRT